MDLHRLEVFCKVIELKNFTRAAEAVRQSVKARIGIAILSRQAVAEDLEAGTMNEVAIQGLSFTRPFYLISRKNRQLSPISSRFLDFLRQGASPEQQPSRRRP